MLNSTCWKSSGSLLTSVLVLCLAGCGGTKLLDKPVPMTVGQPLASAADRQISVAVDWIVVRDGPGTWARNADWDEYLIRVQNLSNTQVEIRDVVIYDSMLIRSDSSGERRMLVAGSKQVARRYADHDIDVRAGLSGSTLLAAGAVGGAAAVGAGSAVLYMSSAAAATTLGVLLAAPALV
ncbi:MAG: hypothetical protein KJN90_11235, partial [Gammaproteobacteria bacterium]|nr:hypothetical protein [Gammaproteobacteria bacterium]